MTITDDAVNAGRERLKNDIETGDLETVRQIAMQLLRWNEALGNAIGAALTER